MSAGKYADIIAVRGDVLRYIAAVQVSRVRRRGFARSHYRVHYNASVGRVGDAVR